MRIGISSTLVKDRSIFELIPLMGERKFLYLEVRCKRDHFDYEDKEEIKKLKSALKRAGVKALALHPPDWVDVGSKNEWERVRSLREAEKCILVARHLGIEKVVIHPSNSETDVEIVRKSLQEVVEFSNEWGVEALLENPFPPKTGSDLKILGMFAEEYRMGICLDTSHLFSNGEVPAEKIRDISHYIKEIHASDSLFSGKDDHLLPGEGKIDWSSLFEAIENRDVDVIIELMPAQNLNKRLDEIEEVMGKWLSGSF